VNVEKKVSAASLSSAVAGVVLYLLQTYAFKSAVPPGIESLVYLAVPAVLAFGAGWLAPHTPRPVPAPPPPPSAVTVLPPEGAA
jgi:hypothetical protein